MPTPLPVTTVRSMTPGKGIDDRTATYCLSPADAVVEAYTSWKCGTPRVGMPDGIKAREEGRKLVKEGSKKGVFHIILPDGRAWFGFPEKAVA